jgi:hypothetical protein
MDMGAAGRDLGTIHGVLFCWIAVKSRRYAAGIDSGRDRADFRR